MRDCALMLALAPRKGWEVQPSSQALLSSQLPELWQLPRCSSPGAGLTCGTALPRDTQQLLFQVSTWHRALPALRHTRRWQPRSACVRLAGAGWQSIGRGTAWDRACQAQSPASGSSSSGLKNAAERCWPWRSPAECLLSPLVPEAVCPCSTAFRRMRQDLSSHVPGGCESTELLLAPVSCRMPAGVEGFVHKQTLTAPWSPG